MAFVEQNTMEEVNYSATFVMERLFENMVDGSLVEMMYYLFSVFKESILLASFFLPIIMPVFTRLLNLFGLYTLISLYPVPLSSNITQTLSVFVPWNSYAIISAIYGKGADYMVSPENTQFAHSDTFMILCGVWFLIR